MPRFLWSLKNHFQSEVKHTRQQIKATLLSLKNIEIATTSVTFLFFPLQLQLMTISRKLLQLSHLFNT